jgi:hypothetical protein
MAQFLMAILGRVGSGCTGADAVLDGLAVVQLEDTEWIDSVVQGEDIVQREDMHMCDLVQSGLTSPAYDVGRWAASLFCIPP